MKGHAAGGSDIVVGFAVSVLVSESSVSVSVGGSCDEVGYDGGVVGAGGAFGTGVNSQAASAPAPTTPAPTATATATVSAAPLVVMTWVIVVAAVIGGVKPLTDMVVGVYTSGSC